MSDSLNVKPGDQLPDFELQAFVPVQGEQSFSIAAQRGKAVVLFWYPKADTPG